MDNTVETDLLMIPGPVQVAPQVLRALSKPMINHRGPEFKKVIDLSREKLRSLFNTESDVLILSGSGTCAMEAAVGNLGGDKKFVALENGKFGERLKVLTSLYGSSAPVVADWGTSINTDKVKQALQVGADAVTIVHNETSTGMTNDVAQIGALCRKHDALLIMDGVSSIGGIEAPIDKWGVDIAFTGSQKCLGLPPGLSMIAVNDRAWDFIKTAQKRPFYADLIAHMKSAEKGQTPYTPAIPLFFALEEALKMLEAEGLSARIDRYRTYATSIRAAIEAMGLELFPQLGASSTYSNTVTAIKMPPGIDFLSLKNEMRQRGIIIAGGQERLKGHIFRISNMGNISKGDILQVIEKLELVLLENGVVNEMGAGTLAADCVLEGL
ncbi:MAG: alanine--glyoxylate aminotransferase family protein [Euryarchaeota archaeon]|jgi:aspartate aminotransferase-like enzyme|nr:alanine--glyoxylate aminotransferase family protein [Euryarchaeota archaeon]